MLSPDYTIHKNCFIYNVCFTILRQALWGKSASKTFIVGFGRVCFSSFLVPKIQPKKNNTDTNNVNLAPTMIVIVTDHEYDNGQKYFLSIG